MNKNIFERFMCWMWKPFIPLYSKSCDLGFKLGQLTKQLLLTYGNILSTLINSGFDIFMLYALIEIWKSKGNLLYFLLLMHGLIIVLTRFYGYFIKDKIS